MDAIARDYEKLKKRIEALESKFGGVRFEPFTETGEGEFPWTSVGYRVTCEPKPAPICRDRNGTELFDGDECLFAQSLQLATIETTRKIGNVTSIVARHNGKTYLWLTEEVILCKRKEAE
jgi:uncharacterized Zn ribbon protein